MRNCVEEARLPAACIFRLALPANQVLVLTHDLRFVRDEQLVGQFEPAVLLRQQLGLHLPDIEGHHPHLNQARGDEQGDGIEYAIEEKRFTQFEAAGRYLHSIDDERCEH